MSDIGFENIDWNQLGNPDYLIRIGVDPTIANSTGTAGPPPGPTTVGGIAQNAVSGRAVVQAILRDAGLDITPEVEQYIATLTTNFGNDLARLGGVVNADLYDTGSTLGKIVDQKYPEIALHAKNGYGAITVGDVLSFRQTATELAKQEGFDVNLLDFKDWIGNGKGLPELQSRIHDAYGALRQADPGAVDQLHTLYGATPGQLGMFAMDPTRTVDDLLRELEAANIGAAGLRTGYGQLAAGQLESLAARGVTAQQAQQGFGELAGMQPLFRVLPGQGGRNITQDTQLAAEFGGDAAAKKTIEEERQRRLATFGGGGGFGAGQKGVVGLGAANTG